MKAADKLDQIEDKLEKIEIKLNTIEIGLSNHLKHHMEQKEWIRWVVPVSLTILNLFLAYGLR